VKADFSNFGFFHNSNGQVVDPAKTANVMVLRFTLIKSVYKPKAELEVIPLSYRKSPKVRSVSHPECQKRTALSSNPSQV
jgi:hypothetical protein